MGSVCGQIHIKEFHVLIVGREPAIFVFVPLSKSFYFHEFSQHACTRDDSNLSPGVIVRPGSMGEKHLTHNRCSTDRRHGD